MVIVVDSKQIVFLTIKGFSNKNESNGPMIHHLLHKKVGLNTLTFSKDPLM